MKSNKLLLITLFFFCQNYNDVFGKKGFGPGNQEWGHFEVYPGSYMFSWFYHANPQEDLNDVNSYNKPLLVWLGYFSSATFNFGGFGPLDLDLQYRNSTLVNDYNNLFIDNVLGAGFSYTTDDDLLYYQNTHDITYMTVSCINRFLKTYPQFKKVPIYIIAQNYNGRIAVELAYRFDLARWINEHNTFNLAGIVLGNPSISFIDTVKLWIKLFKSTNLFDDQQQQSMDSSYELAKSLVQKKEYRIAYNITCSFLDNYLEALGTPENYREFNKLNAEDFSDIIFNEKIRDVMNNQVKKALGLSFDWTLQNSDGMFEGLKNEIMIPMLHQLQSLINSNKIKVAIFNTNLNFEVSKFNTLNWVTKLKKPVFSKSDSNIQVPFRVGNNIIGTYRNIGKFYQFQIFKQIIHGVELDPAETLRSILHQISG